MTRLVLLFLASSIIFASSAAQSAAFTSEQLQAWWESQIAQGRAAVMPYAPFESEKSFERSILYGLRDDAEYRKNLDQWLAENQYAYPDEALSDWKRHFHLIVGRAIQRQFPAGATRILFLLSTPYSVYRENRSACDGISASHFADLVNSDQEAGFKAVDGRLGEVVSQAIGRQFKDENAGKGEDSQQLQASLVSVTMTSFKSIAASLPEADAKRLSAAFSDPSSLKQVTPEEVCLRALVTSHAIGDSNLDNLKNGQSAAILRASVTSSNLNSFFAEHDSIVSFSLPGFSKKLVRVEMPEILFSSVNGNLSIKVYVDETGHVSKAEGLENTLSPAQVIGVDGATLDASTLLMNSVKKALHGGFFIPHMSGDKAVPYRFILPFSLRSGDSSKSR